MPTAKKSSSSKRSSSSPSSSSSSKRGAASRRKSNPDSKSSAARSSRSAKTSPSSSGSAKRRGTALSKTTTDHDEIRQWAEARGAKPSCVRGTGGKRDTGMIRLDFPGFSGADSLEEITWDEFFEAFDDNGLALVYQEKTAAGRKSNFNKLVSRDNAE